MLLFSQSKFLGNFFQEIFIINSTDKRIYHLNYLYIKSLHRDRFCKISRHIHVFSFIDRDIIAQKLQWDAGDD